MAMRVGSIVLNCEDLDLMTEFWSAALNLKPGLAKGGFRLLRGSKVNLALQVSDTPITGRDQMHLDLYTTNRVAEVRRLTRLGAVHLRHHRDPDDDYVVLADPEGNPFCVVEA